jgi:hypothetical protein
MNKLPLLTAVALALQVAFAQPEQEPKWDPAQAVQYLVTMVRSPEVHKGKGVVSQRAREVTDRAFEQETLIMISSDYGIGTTYKMKDGSSVRTLEESDGRKGVEIWWPCPQTPDTPNVLTVRSDGSYGYCRIGGKVRHPYETFVSGDVPGLTTDMIDTEFKRMSHLLAGHFAPAQK